MRARTSTLSMGRRSPVMAMPSSMTSRRTRATSVVASVIVGAALPDPCRPASGAGLPDIAPLALNVAPDVRA
jgi:hypothetical protein